MLDTVRGILKPASAYFGIVFSAGFMLGAVRIFYLVPAYGERVAELIEIPFMTAISFASAYFIVKRFEIRNVVAAFFTGFLALVILLAFEFTVVLGLRGLTVEEYVATRDVISGIAYLCGLILYGIFPLVVTVGLNRKDI